MKKFTNILDRILSFFIPNKYAKICRYIISGGTAAATDLVLLFLFTSILHIWYLLSAILAFIIAFWVSFILQKFWTFDDHGVEAWKSQALIYFIVTSTNLGINTLLMYVCVDVFHIHYFISQILVSILIAMQSYFVYQKFVFKKNVVSTEDHQSLSESSLL